MFEQLRIFKCGRILSLFGVILEEMNQSSLGFFQIIDLPLGIWCDEVKGYGLSMARGEGLREEARYLG